MPFYKPLKRQDPNNRNRTIAGIKRIREQFNDENFPQKTYDKSLILGTWNIRNFDDNRFNYGPRLTESLYYIAEVISRFDILAIQEVCEDLAPLDELMAVLGGHYDYIMTDVTHSSLGGNKERLGFIYDKKKVSFKGIAGEIVLPDKMMISEVDGIKRQFSRTPFSVQFQSGWFKFLFSTVHIYYGSNSVSSPQYQRRVKEIEAVAKYLAKDAKASDANQILVGDFNIKARGSAGFNVLEESGFKIVQNRKGSNKDRTKFYDQISFRTRANELKLLEPERDDRVFQFFDSVYREEDFTTYLPLIKKDLEDKLQLWTEAEAVATSKTALKKAQAKIKSLNKSLATNGSLKDYYDDWRTFQMSDHLPLWVEIEIDFSDAYLNHLEGLGGVS